MMVIMFIMIHGGNMIEVWMPITANVILFLMGLLFVAGGANTMTRMFGVIGIVISVVSLLFNVGVLK